MTDKGPLNKGWVGFDFDGTLCQFPYPDGLPYGPNQPKMVGILRNFIAAGAAVKIVTARASDPYTRASVNDWLRKNDFPAIPITDKKDWTMLALFDDRAITVDPITGEVMTDIDSVSRMLKGAFPDGE